MLMLIVVIVLIIMDKQFVTLIAVNGTTCNVKQLCCQKHNVILHFSDQTFT